MSIATSVLEAVEAEAQKHGGGRVLKIGLRIGEWSGVDPESLRFCFDALAADSEEAAPAIEIDFASAAIGRQRRAFEVDPANFRSEIARARTFGFVSDVERLWKMGFALGSSLDNCVALDGERILNPEGLRYADEFVRHKALDSIGDLSLAGAPIIGGYRSYMPGHKMNFLALSALFADRSAYEFVEAEPRREFASARAGHGALALAAYAAEVD